MRHVVQSICGLKPTHALLLGDIFSFQRLSDREFAHRYERFKWIFQCSTIILSFELHVHGAQEDAVVYRHLIC